SGTTTRYSRVVFNSFPQSPLTGRFPCDSRAIFGRSPLFRPRGPAAPSGRARGLGALDVALPDPRHQIAEAGSGFFDAVFFAVLEELFIRLVPALVCFDPFAGELAALDVLEG